MCRLPLLLFILLTVMASPPLSNVHLPANATEGHFPSSPSPIQHIDTPRISCGSFAKDNNTLLTGWNNGELTLWSLKSNSQIKTIQAHRRTIKDRKIGARIGIPRTSAVTFLDDAKHALSGGADNLIKLWRFPEGENIRTYSGHTKPITCIAPIDKLGQFASASEDGTLRLWNTQKGTQLAILDTPSSRILALTVSNDQQRLAAINENGTVLQWDVATRKRYPSLDLGPQVSTAALAYSASGRYLLAAAGRTVVALEVQTRKEIGRIQVRGIVVSVAFATQGQLAHIADDEAVVHLWKPSTQTPPRTVRWSEGTGGNGAFFSQTSSLALLYDPLQASLWDLRSQRRIITLWPK